MKLAYPAIIGLLAVFLTIEAFAGVPSETDRYLSAFRYVVHRKAELRTGIREFLARPSESSETFENSTEFGFHEKIQMADGWLFLAGGSFAGCSDDIICFLLFHPEKDILRVLFAEFTGSVEGGRFLIGDSGKSVIVSQECMGNSPPRRFLLKQGIPVEDHFFNRSFELAFSWVGAVLGGRMDEFYFSRELSFHGPAGEFRLAMTVYPQYPGLPEKRRLLMDFYEKESVIQVDFDGKTFLADCSDFSLLNNGFNQKNE